MAKNRIPKMVASESGLCANQNAANAAAKDTQNEDTIRHHLRVLQNVDSKRVLLVRKINRLGFESPMILRAHFSFYGAVENVLVSHSRVKTHPLKSTGSTGKYGYSRMRPSGLGFIVMSTWEEVERILADGSEQIVAGMAISVQNFEHRQAQDFGNEE